MRSKRNKTRLAAGLLLLLLSAACSNRPKEVLDIKEMADILVELHTLDGIFSTHEHSSLAQEEKDKYYEAILEQHGIHQAQFDSSLVWYSRDPKKFEKVYVRVIDRLTAEEQTVKEGKYHPIVPETQQTHLASVNLWKDSTRFDLHGDSLKRQALTFTIADTALMTADRYELRFRQRTAPKDSCAGQHLYFRLHYAGGTTDSIGLYSRPDSLLRRYTLRLNAWRKDKVDSLHVCFFASDSCLCAQHVYLDSLSLTRTYDAGKQDELRALTRQREAFRTFAYRLVPMPGEMTDFAFKKRRMNIRGAL